MKHLTLFLVALFYCGDLGQYVVQCQQVERRELPKPPRLAISMKIDYRQISSGNPPYPSPKAQGALGYPAITRAELDPIYQDIQEGLRYIFQTKNDFTFAVHGTGTCAANAVIDALIETGDKVLVLSMGHWGDLQADMASRLGANVTLLQMPIGSTWQLADIANALFAHRPQILLMVRGESDTGVRQDMTGIGELCRQVGALLVVDHVAIAGIQPVLMDQLGIDAIYMNHKGCGIIPGLASLSLSPRAVEKLKQRKTPPRSYYTDLNKYAVQWNVSGSAVNASPYQRHHSPSVAMLYGLREALAVIAEEGIENVWRRHEAMTEKVHKGMLAMGFTEFVTARENRLIGIMTFVPPQGKDTVKIADFLLKKFSIDVSPGYHKTYGLVLRIGAIMNSATEQKTNKVLSSVEKALLSPETNK